jgi:hypothetical protein
MCFVAAAAEGSEEEGRGSKRTASTSSREPISIETMGVLSTSGETRRFNF